MGKKKFVAKLDADILRLKLLADIKQNKLDEIARIKREKALAIAGEKRRKEITVSNP